MNNFSLTTSKPIFVTGVAGFIGFHLCQTLLDEGHAVIGYDNVNDYYDVGLKRGRLAELQKYKDFQFVEADLCSADKLKQAYVQSKADYVVHLAAQAGVRYSLENPQAYIDSNITGFLNMLEACRTQPPKHFLYASSSSVYGNSAKESGQASKEDDRTDSPISFYGATKKAGEVMASNYSRMLGMPTTGLRFFTVYGEWGRPDMAIPIFADKMTKGEPITLYNNGNMSRDFTYIGDIIQGVRRILACPSAGHRLYNIGAGKPQQLQQVVSALEAALGCSANIEYAELQTGDPLSSHADCSALEAAVGYHPETSLQNGIARFAEWYKGYR